MKLFLRLLACGCVLWIVVALIETVPMAQTYERRITEAVNDADAALLRPSTNGMASAAITIQRQTLTYLVAGNKRREEARTALRATGAISAIFAAMAAIALFLLSGRLRMKPVDSNPQLPPQG